MQWLISAFVEASPDTEAFILLLQASSWIMEKCYPYIAAFFTPPKTLDELQSDANVPAKGYEIHHIVEKAQADADGIPESAWDGPENKVRIPTLKHWQITRWYMTPDDEFGGLSPRDYLHEKLGREGSCWSGRVNPVWSPEAMRSEELKALTTDQLVDRFAELGVAPDKAIWDSLTEKTMVPRSIDCSMKSGEIDKELRARARGEIGSHAALSS